VIAFLEPLARLPGVESVVLVSHDGVPIAHVSGRGGTVPDESLAALAASWLNEVGQAVAPLGWHAPERICLRAARGTLVLRHSSSACLVVCLGREASPEDVRLSMDGVLARIERARHGRGRTETVAPSESGEGATPRGAIPSRVDAPPTEEDLRPASNAGQAPGN